MYLLSKTISELISTVAVLFMAMSHLLSVIF